jgi:alpha-L-fucosidase
MNLRLACCLPLSFILACGSVDPPAAVMPIPSERQLAWQDMEFYMFVHFNMNTFTNMEWGTGAEDPVQFNPTALDANQWARVAKENGMKGIIITAKHHDGFCLWPTSTTSHSIAYSPYKNGEGDIVKEVAEACEKHGLKFGVYLSPWDRNHPEYGNDAYIEVFREQLRELLTRYGHIFEVWFDGANGGTGYYGGANEDRRVDKKTYYDWPNTYSLIRNLQPDAVIFGDAGPDVRWVGNEHGFAYETTWSNLMRDSIYGGMPEYSEKYSAGQENGTHWVPAEADVSIRPGWYYHPYEDHKVKSLPELLDIYYYSIGRNSSLLLNFPVDSRGLIHENDVEQVEKLYAKIQEDFKDDLIQSINQSHASISRGRGFGVDQVLDGNLDTYWSTPDGQVKGDLTFEFPSPTALNRLLVQEHIPLGQRIKAFEIEAKMNGEWVTWAEGTTVGYKRILRLDEKEVEGVRFSVLDAKASPTIANLALYRAPKLLLAPIVERDKSGRVTLIPAEENLKMVYSLDGTDPNPESTPYEGPFMVVSPSVLKAAALEGEEISDPVVQKMDIPKAAWKVISKGKNPEHLVDENPRTNFISENNEALVDLGESYSIKGFTYLPMQNRYMTGVIKEYEFAVSRNGRNWETVKKGEFGNIANSPVLQELGIDPVNARYIRLRAIDTLDGEPASFAELGVVTEGAIE